MFYIIAITGCPSISITERNLLAVTVRLGDLGISKPTINSAIEHSCSKKLTDSLVTLILSQNTTIPPDLFYAQGQVENRSTGHGARNTLCRRPTQNYPSTSLLRSMQQCSEKGSSSWLSALPICDHGFFLTKGHFMMLYAFNTTRNPHISQVTVSVVKDLQSTYLIYWKFSIFETL